MVLSCCRLIAAAMEILQACDSGESHVKNWRLLLQQNIDENPLTETGDPVQVASFNGAWPSIEEEGGGASNVAATC
uniref:RxLR effector candidate protein n=1 Tax=Hyaloperonospora arabidopsidis (strain Emoy2) TaxID=559515 RepID=M4BW53_HYAAE